MSGNERRPPVVSVEVAQRIIRDLFPFSSVVGSSYRELPCYDDRHYYFEGHVNSQDEGEDEKFVLRVNNLMFPTELVEGSNAVMLHLWSRGINCTRPVASRSGRYLEMVSGNKLCSHHGSFPEQFPVRVLKFVSGVCMNELDEKFKTPAFLYNVGNFAGKVDAALQDFNHPAIEGFVHECWDLQHFLCLNSYIPQLTDKQKRATANSIVKLYENTVQPHLPRMKKGVIHGDLHGHNIIVQKSGSEAEIVGLIDFGDCVCSYYLFELAILVAYSMLDQINPVEFVVPVIRGYLDVFPLSQEELDILFYAVLALLCTTAVKGECNIALEPGNTHIQHFVPNAWRLLSLLLPMSKDRIDNEWKFRVSSSLT